MSRDHLNIPVRPSRRGEPTWETIELFPEQGDWTEEEYLALDTKRLVEFTDGTLEVLPLPDWMHQALQGLLWSRLRELSIDGKRGRATQAGFKVRLREGKWRLPDVLYLRPENEHLFNPEWWTHVDFAIEIVSKHRHKRDYVKKRAEYAKAGIPEYWIVDPLKREVLVLILDAGADVYREIGTFGSSDTIRSATLPGFEVDLANCLPRPKAHDRQAHPRHHDPS